MNFIESIFGISPDSGSALLEWLLLLMPFVVTVGSYVRKSSRLF